jgi:hypothetical protein
MCLELTSSYPTISKPPGFFNLSSFSQLPFEEDGTQKLTSPFFEREFAVGTAEQLESKLTGHGYACPHFPKFRSQESGYPSRLGFFHGNDNSKIRYVELDKLCENCRSDVVPTSKEYNVWLSSGLQTANGVASKESCVWVTPQPSKGFPLELVQAGTPLKRRELIGPPAVKETMTRGVFNTPIVITIAEDGMVMAEGKWETILH